MLEQNESKEMTIAKDKALAEFELTPAKISQIAEEYMHITVPEGDKDAYKIARAGLTICVKARTGTDARRKELGVKARDWLADIAEAARALVEPLVPVEAHLKAEVYNEDNRLKEKKAEKARKEFERVEEIRDKVKAIMGLSAFMNPQTTSEDMRAALTNAEAIEITEEEYMEFAFEAQKTRETVCAELVKGVDIREEFEAEEKARKAEEERIVKERKAEDKRLAEEREDLKAEKARQDAVAKEQSEEQERLETDRKRYNEKQKEQREKEHAMVQTKIEEQERAERKEKEKAEAEAKEAEEKTRIEAMKPDKEKLIAWIDAVQRTYSSVADPALNTTQSKSAFSVVAERIGGSIMYAQNLIEGL